MQNDDMKRFLRFVAIGALVYPVASIVICLITSIWGYDKMMTVFIFLSGAFCLTIISAAIQFTVDQIRKGE